MGRGHQPVVIDFGMHIAFQQHDGILSLCGVVAGLGIVVDRQIMRRSTYVYGIAALRRSRESVYDCLEISLGDRHRP